MKMKKLIGVLFFIMITFISFTQQPIKLSTSLGTYFIRYAGTGNWNWATQMSAEEGYRLPTGKELEEILMETAGNNPFWKSWNAQGYSEKGERYKWFWTNKNYDESWSDFANQTMSMGMRYGLSNFDMYNPYSSGAKNGDFDLFDRNMVGNVLILYKQGEKISSSKNNSEKSKSSNSSNVENKSSKPSSNKESEKIAKTEEKSDKSSEPKLYPCNPEKIDITSLVNKNYKLYLQPGQKSTKFEWDNPNQSHPTPENFLPQGKNYFEFPLKSVTFLKGNPEINKYTLSWGLGIPVEEKCIISTMETDSNLLSKSKFKVTLNYVTPPKSKWSHEIFYVYCDELRNDLLIVGVK